MKKLPFFLLLIACVAFRNARAQCAVYKAKDDGICGVQFDNGQPPYATMDEVKAEAKKACERSGGKNCQLAYAGYETGWWVIVRGSALKENKVIYLFRVMIFETKNTQEAKAAAEKRSIQVFMDESGEKPIVHDVLSWYVPRKQE